MPAHQPSLCAQVGTVFQPLMTYEAPPTYFSTGKLTDSFQNIVDAYGMARCFTRSSCACLRWPGMRIKQESFES